MQDRFQEHPPSSYRKTTDAPRSQNVREVLLGRAKGKRSLKLEIGLLHVEYGVPYEVQ